MTGGGHDDGHDSREPGSWRSGSGLAEGWTALARAEGVLGELVLRRRGTASGPLTNLVCAGVDVMDDQETTSERELATAALDELDASAAGGAAGGADDAAGASPARPGRHVVVGGLGLGFTVAELLGDLRLGDDGRVTVVEVEPAVVAWNRAGLVPATAGVLDDPRVDVVVGDLAEVLPVLVAERPASADALLLDVDNGPGFLVVPANQRLYTPAALAAAAQLLRSGGVLAVWCAQPAPELGEALTEAVGPARVRRSSVVREGRPLTYHVHLATRR